MSTREYIDKNIRLIKEFDTYLLDHPELYDDIPNKATVVITVDDDQEFNAESLRIGFLRKARRPLVEARKSSQSWSIRALTPQAA
ncbi:hypothetical protein EPO04_00610 [Patescibacteria group bacterium]|nr:MAG: hypothetical protein EPO04_00610 [Patescibacteria group bacterium]